MEGTDLTLEQKSLKRANYALTSSISYVSIPLILMYLGQILQGYSVVKSLAVAGMIALVMILCIAAYRRNPLSVKFHSAAFLFFLIAYETACLSSTNFFYNIFIYPVLISMVMYFDMKSALSPPIICFRKITLTAIGIRQQIPILQSNTKIRMMTATGITTAPVRSGNWWARKPSVRPALSSITFLKRPLAFWLK